MTVTLSRPSVNLMTLRDGTSAIAISGGPNRVLVRPAQIGRASCRERV